MLVLQHPPPIPFNSTNRSQGQSDSEGMLGHQAAENMASIHILEGEGRELLVNSIVVLHSSIYTFFSVIIVWKLSTCVQMSGVTLT